MLKTLAPSPPPIMRCGTISAAASILTDEQAKLLSTQGAAVQWFMGAFGHCKTIAHDDTDKFIGVGTRRHWAREPKIRDFA